MYTNKTNIRLFSDLVNFLSYKPKYMSNIYSN